MSDELTDLRNLLLHPGFLWLQRYQRRYWSDQLGTAVRSAVDDRDDGVALARLRQVIAAKDATERLLQAPADRLRQLEVRMTPPPE